MTDNLIEIEDSLKGNTEKVINTINSPQNGARKYWPILASLGKTSSLEKSLIASLNGWAIPIILTLFGPFRNWLYPKIFRSNKVTKATLTNVQITKII